MSRLIQHKAKFNAYEQAKLEEYGFLGNATIAECKMLRNLVYGVYPAKLRRDPERILLIANLLRDMAQVLRRTEVDEGYAESAKIAEALRQAGWYIEEVASMQEMRAKESGQGGDPGR